MVIVVALLVTLSSFAASSPRPLGQSLASPLAAPDFSVACCFPNPIYNIRVEQGSTLSTFGYVTSVNGFSGTVSLTLNLPFTSSISPTSLVLTANATSLPDVKISVPSTAPIGNYYGNLTGQSGSIIHFQALTVQVVGGAPDFPVTASRSSVDIERGSSTSLVVLVSSVFGFYTVNSCFNSLGDLWVSPAYVTPSVASGPSISFSQSCLTLSAGGTNSTMMMVSTSAVTPPGNYSVEVDVCFPLKPQVRCNVATVTVIVFSDPPGAGGGGGKALST